MKKSDLVQAVAILANLGVIAGIVFLAVELRQNNSQLQTQIAVTRHQIRVDDIGRVVLDADLAAARLKFQLGEPISDVEHERLYWMYATRFLNWELAHSLGNLEPRPVIAMFRETPQAINFWERYEPYLNPDLIAYVEENVLPQAGLQ